MNNYFYNVFRSPTEQTIAIQKKYNRKHYFNYIVMNKIPYPLKSKYNINIPLNIFQTWHTKDLKSSMRNAVNNIIYNNPKFNYYLFDDNDCRNFIEKNFDNKVLNAFDSLIPGAFKADLWRYCVLYIKGGIYLDIKYEPHNNFRFINLCEQEHWCLDCDNNNIYNAIIVSKPNNPILYKAIYDIVYHVEIKYYGNSCLEPTGPALLTRYFNNSEKNKFKLQHFYINNFNNRFISFNNFIILRQYKNYLTDYANNSKTQYYGTLWNERRIYN